MKLTTLRLYELFNAANRAINPQDGDDRLPGRAAFRIARFVVNIKSVLTTFEVQRNAVIKAAKEKLGDDAGDEAIEAEVGREVREMLEDEHKIDIVAVPIPDDYRAPSGVLLPLVEFGVFGEPDAGAH